MGKDIRSWGRDGSNPLQQMEGSVQNWVLCEVSLETVSMALLRKSSFWLKVSRSNGFPKTNAGVLIGDPEVRDMGREEESEADLCNYMSGASVPHRA